MKKGSMVAIAGLLIVLALFGYSYYANKADKPALPDKKATVNATAPTEKKTTGTSTANDKTQASPGSGTQPGNNDVNKSNPEPATSPAVSNKPTIEEKAPRNAAEAIEQAKKNGESMWLLFRSTTCIPCVEMQKVFDQVEPDYKGKVRFIAIDVNDRNNSDILKSWKIRYIPTTFIIDGTGNISYQNVGVIPTDDLKKELNKVVK